MGTNDQITQVGGGVGGGGQAGGGELMVKSFQRSSQVSFPLIYTNLGYW